MFVCSSNGLIGLSSSFIVSHRFALLFYPNNTFYIYFYSFISYGLNSYKIFRSFFYVACKVQYFIIFRNCYFYFLVSFHNSYLFYFTYINISIAYLLLFIFHNIYILIMFYNTMKLQHIQTKTIINIVLSAEDDYYYYDNILRRFNKDLWVEIKSGV